jgi:hypothetical protein
MRMLPTGLRNWDNRELVICTDRREWWVAALCTTGKYVGACSETVKGKAAALELARRFSELGNRSLGPLRCRLG